MGRFTHDLGDFLILNPEKPSANSRIKDTIDSHGGNSEMTERGSDPLDAVIAEGFLSADCHVFEPRDLFRRRMQKKFRDRAPGMVSKSDSHYNVCDGLPDQPIGIEAS